MAKFKPAKSCEICGKHWKKPTMRKYDICDQCRIKLKSKHKWNEENLKNYLNKNGYTHTKCQTKISLSGF